MPQHVCNGAMMMCSFGAAPSTLTVLPANRVLTSNQPAANIMDHLPMVNVMPFGMCMAPANPQVISATAAAMGVLTPMPCSPLTVVSPWAPGAVTVLVGDQPALDNTSQLLCMWGGVITISMPGQFTEEIP